MGNQHIPPEEQARRDAREAIRVHENEIAQWDIDRQWGFDGQQVFIMQQQITPPADVDIEQQMDRQRDVEIQRELRMQRQQRDIAMQRELDRQRENERQREIIMERRQRDIAMERELDRQREIERQREVDRQWGVNRQRDIDRQREINMERQIDQHRHIAMGQQLDGRRGLDRQREMDRQRQIERDFRGRFQPQPIDNRGVFDRPDLHQIRDNFRRLDLRDPQQMHERDLPHIHERESTQDRAERVAILDELFSRDRRGLRYQFSNDAELRQARQDARREVLRRTHQHGLPDLRERQDRDDLFWRRNDNREFRGRR